MQPMTDLETRTGAFNRAFQAAAMYKEDHGSFPDFAVGLEGGVVVEEISLPSGEGVQRDMACFAWMAVLRPSDSKWGTANAISRPYTVARRLIHSA